MSKQQDPLYLRLLRMLTRQARRLYRLAILGKMSLQGLPRTYAKPAYYILTGLAGQNAQEVQESVEAQRQRIASREGESADVFYSPKPGSSGEEVTDEIRPDHGKVMSFTMERVADTGKDKRWGTVLHMIASDVGGTFIELGSCAGISSAYLASAPGCEKLITIEGSSSLAEIARETMGHVALGHVEVINGLFDDVLDDLLPELGENSIDLAFIDGHHERVATLHYFERLKPALRPGATVIFDDVSWSQDMRKMWREVCEQSCIRVAADFGAIGVTVYNPFLSAHSYWNLQPVVGRRDIGEPWGWKE